MYGEGAVSGRTWQMWFVKFCASHFSLDDALQSGRPVEVGSNQIKTLIESNQHYTTWEIADILKVFKSIKLLVKIFSFHLLSFWKTYSEVLELSQG